MGEKPKSDSTSVSGEAGASFAGEGARRFWVLVRDEARLVEFEAEEEVESSGISTTFQVCNVASGANDTRRFAGKAECQRCFEVFYLSVTNPLISVALPSSPKCSEVRAHGALSRHAPELLPFRRGSRKWH